MPLTSSEGRAIEIVEKVTSVFSVLGAGFIISTFLANSKFRKPINRLVFFAAWGNLFANVATLISRTGIAQGVTSPLCQFQAFLIHWFMPADALWTFAMACNVYLSFFRHYDASGLRSQEWKYMIGCYGIPLVPALVFLFIDTVERGKIYGDARLWCWISTSWSVLRIATFYGPVWLVILLTIFIYTRVGLVVFRWRRQLLSLEHIKSIRHTEVDVRDIPSPGPGKRYEVTITSQVPHSPPAAAPNFASPRATMHEQIAPVSPRHGRFESINETAFPTTPHRPASQGTKVVVRRPTIKTLDANRAALTYFKTAILFFVALLCTWVPSTINRILGFARADSSIFALDMTAATVLPLQGFWNTVIYIVTSWAACKSMMAALVAPLSGNRAPRAERSRPISLGISKHGRRRTLESDDDRADIIVNINGKSRVVSRRDGLQHDDLVGDQRN